MYLCMFFHLHCLFTASNKVSLYLHSLEAYQGPQSLTVRCRFNGSSSPHLKSSCMWRVTTPSMTFVLFPLCIVNDYNLLVPTNPHIIIIYISHYLAPP